MNKIALLLSDIAEFHGGIPSNCLEPEEQRLVTDLLRKNYVTRKRDYPHGNKLYITPLGQEFLNKKGYLLLQGEQSED